MAYPPAPRLRNVLMGTLLALGLVAMQVGPTAAQPNTGTVRVRVEHEGAPVPGAEVRSAPGPGVLTNERGLAVLQLPPGPRTILVRAAGFAPAATMLQVQAGEDTTVVMALEAAVIIVEPIVVRATRTGRLLEDEPLRVEVIEREEIEEKTLMTPGDVAMLLNETGGVRVQVTSPALGAANVRVQGMRGRYTQLLADGLPLYGGPSGSIGLLQIPPSDLGQVEVIKGVASALYGGYAMGGVINLVSREPSAVPLGEVLLNATSLGGEDVTAYVSGPVTDAVGYTALAGFHRQTKQDLDGSGWAEVAGHRRWTVRPRVHWDGGDGRWMFLTAGGVGERREGGGSTVAGAFREALNTDRLDAGLAALLPLAGPISLQLRTSAMAQEHEHQFGPAQERDRHTAGFAEVALTGETGPRAWLLGFAYQSDDFRSETFPAFDYAYRVPAVFAQAETPVGGLARASASVRWDDHSEYGPHLSPRLAVLLRPGAWTLRVSAGAGFFAPAPFTEEIEAAGLSRLEPLEGLRSERAKSASLDLGRRIGPLELNAALFASRVDDAVQLIPVATDQSYDRVRLDNIEGETRTGGAELLARWRWQDVSVTGSYVYVRATEPHPFHPVRREVPLTPRHTAGLVGMWESHDRGRLGVEAYYTGRQALDDNPYRTEGKPYLLLGLLGELRQGPASFFVNLENLLNVRQTRWDPLVSPFRYPDGRWTVDAWAPLEGFALNGGVRVRLGGAPDPD